MSGGNAQQRKKFSDAVNRTVAEVVRRLQETNTTKVATHSTAPETDQRHLKQWSRKNIFSAAFLWEATVGLFWSWAIGALSMGDYVVADWLFGIGDVLLFWRLGFWSREFVKKDRYKVIAIGSLACLFVIVPQGFYLYSKTKPAFLIVRPIAFDPTRERQYFAIWPTWKPLTSVEITLVDNVSALALGKNAKQALMQMTFPEVSSSYIVKTFSWDKPVPTNPLLDDSYLIDIGSHEGGNYSEDLQIHRFPDGKQIVLIEINDKNNKSVYSCEDFPGFRDQKRKNVPNCSGP